MAKKILFVLFLISLFLIPLIFASTTEINIKTANNDKILVTALNSGDSYQVIRSFAPYKNTGIMGDVKLSLTTSETSIRLKMDLITEDGTEVVNHIFEDVPTGQPVFITFFPGNFDFTVGNSTIITVNTTNTTSSAANQTNQTNSTNQSTTIENASAEVSNLIDQTNLSNNYTSSFSLSKIYQDNSKTLFYILIVIGVIVVILILIFVVMKFSRRKRSDGPITIRQSRPHESSVSPTNPSLMDAEKKLKEAQQEIEAIKRRNQDIYNAERKLKEDSIRLEKMKRGY